MIYLISTILLLLPTYLIRFSIFSIPTTLLEIVIYLVFIYGLYRAIKDGFRRLPLFFWLPIGLLIVSLIISVVVAPDKRIASGEFKGFFVDPILVGWLVFQFIKKEDLPKLFWSLIFSGTFVAIHTIILKILGQVTADGRVIGIFGYSPNYISLYLAPIATLIIAYGLSPMGKKKYLLSGLCAMLFAINIVALYFSGSRGGFLAVVAGIGVYFIVLLWGWIRKRISGQIIVAILIIFAIYTAWTFFQPDFSVSPESGGRVATSNNLRWEIWKTSLELGKNHPLLGVGLGNFQNAFGNLTANRPNYPEYITPQALTSHNIFIMFWLSTGILGLIAFAWLLVVFAKNALKKISDDSTKIILAVMATIVFYGLIESSIWKNDLSVIFWVFWGMIWTVENGR